MGRLWERVGLLASIALLLGGCGGPSTPPALPSDSQDVVEVSDASGDEPDAASILDAGVQDAADVPRAPAPDSDLLTRRKRDEAWERFGDPVQRLAEEALLYPMDPLPEPDGEGFPLFEPALPPLPELFTTARGIARLLDAVQDMLPPPVTPREPEPRLGDEPDAPELAPPPIPKLWD